MKEISKPNFQYTLHCTTTNGILCITHDIFPVAIGRLPIPDGVSFLSSPIGLAAFLLHALTDVNFPDTAKSGPALNGLKS